MTSPRYSILFRRLRILTSTTAVVAIVLCLQFTTVAAPPELLEARWRTTGEDPTYLDLYPLFGRSASTQIYVQADLRSDAPISASQVDIFLENPILLPGSFDTFAFEQIIKGNGGDATVQATLWIDNDIDWTAWTPETTLSIKLSARDTSGEEAVYDLGEVRLYGPQPGDILPDVTPAQIVGSTINNGNTISIPENFPDNSFEFPASLQAMDDGKGFQGAFLSYRHEDGWSISLSVDRSALVSGTVNDGVFSGTSFISKFAAPGTYELRSFSTSDKAGNQYFGDLEDAPPGIQRTVEVINPNAESEPPILSGPVMVTPLIADVKTEPTTVSFTFPFEEVGSGFGSGNIRLFHTSETESASRFAFFSSFNIQEGGDAFMGTLKVDIQIPMDLPPGEYAYQIELSDVAGNSSDWGRQRPNSSFEPMPLPEGSNETITVESEPPPPPDDTTPPVLESIQVVCTHDFMTGPGEIDVTITASDDKSPLDIGQFFSSGNFIRFTSPTGATVAAESLTLDDLTSGDALSGTYNFKVSLNKAVEPGQYCILVQLRNEADLTSTYGLNYEQLPFPNEFSGYCEIINTGPVDYTPPIPVEFSAIPDMVTEGTDVTVTVTVKVSDPSTGLQEGSISIYNGMSSLVNFRQQIFTTQTNFLPPDEEGGVGVGTKNEATYTFEIPLLGTDFSGDFLSFQLRLTDCAGNVRWYDSSICDARGSYPLPRHISQIGIINIIDEQDYEAYAWSFNSPFPFQAGFQQRAYDFDYDGDRQSNGDEFAAGTNPADGGDWFRTMVNFDPGIGTKIIFTPYSPTTNEYTLYRNFEGAANNETNALNESAQPYEENSSWGYFILAPSSGLEELFLSVSTLKTQL